MNSICKIVFLLLMLFSFNKSSAVNKVILSEKDFNSCFPLRNTLYTYASFSKAAVELSFIMVKIEKRGDWIYKITRTDKRTKKGIIVRQDPDWDAAWAKAKPYSITEVNYGDFCASKDVYSNKKELAAFFAHVAHETRNGMNKVYNDGLMMVTESNTNADYNTQNVAYPAVAGQKYYGRGPLQLSYNGNYGFASDCIFGNKTLLEHPDLVASNAVIAFETAIYFWMTPQSLKPSVHDVITGKWTPSAADKEKGYTSGFGTTINIINGKVECGKGENQPAMQDRIAFYQYFLKKFNVRDANCACSCGIAAHFSE